MNIPLRRLLRILQWAVIGILAAMPAGAQVDPPVEDMVLDFATVDPSSAPDGAASAEGEPATSPEPTMPQKPTPPRPSMAPT